MYARSIAAIGAAVALLAWSSLARAQTVVVQPGPGAPFAQPVATAAPVIATLQPAQPLPATLAITAPPAPPPLPPQPAPTPETAARTAWRPDRTLLMSGLVLFSVPYIASVGIAANSSRASDGNLAVPIIGPWLDLGGRRGCQGPGCGAETGYEVLLALDGILQSVGALQIVGAFLFPEGHEVTTIATGRTTSLTLGPSRVGPGAYGLAAVGNF
jgi:hypothetical protein